AQLVPDWRGDLGVGVALPALGLGALLFARTALRRPPLGALAGPGGLLAPPDAAPRLRAGGQGGAAGVAGPRRGGRRVLGGSAAGLLAALLALGQLGGRGEPAAGWPAPMLAVLGIGGLLYGWLVGMRVAPGSAVPAPVTGYFQTLTDPDVRRWTTAVL